MFLREIVCLFAGERFDETNLDIKGKRKNDDVAIFLLQGTDRIQYWKDKGYVRQDLGESGSFLFEPGQDFKINFLGNVVATGTKSLRKLTFVPKRPSYQPYR